MEGHVRPLGRDDVRGILQRGGTILGTSRRDPYVHGDGYASVRRTVEANGIDAVIVIGGDGTLRTALALHEEGLRVVGVPKTIDNDIPGTDMTFGFDTAVSIATEALDRHLDDGRVAQPDHGRRGDGPHEGLDRDLRRASRPAPTRSSCPRSSPTSRRSPTRSGRATATAAPTRSSSSPRAARRRAASVGQRRDRRVRVRAARRRRLPLRRRARAADRLRDAGHRARPSAARRHARRRSTACSRPASASPPSTSRRPGGSARWPPSAATEVVGVPLAEACARGPRRRPGAARRRADVLRLTAG